MPSALRARYRWRPREPSQIGGRLPVLVTFEKRGRRIGDHLLKQKVHKQKQWLCLEHEQQGLVFRIVVEVLMHAPRFDDHDIAGLPRNFPAVMDIVTASLQYEEHRAVQMSVLLAIGAWSIGFDVGLDGLRDLSAARRNADL